MSQADGLLVFTLVILILLSAQFSAMETAFSSANKIKLRNLTRFLSEGDKAKVTMRFRGREMAHQEFGVRLLEKIRNDLEPVSQVEQFPKL